MNAASSPRRSAQDVAVEWAFRTGWAVTRYVPDAVASAGFAGIADGLWRRRAADVVQLERNIARVRPDLAPPDVRDVARLSLRSYMRYWKEAFEVPFWRPGYVRTAFTMENPDAVDAVVAAGRGAIVVATHSGSWDLAGAWFADRYGKVTTVAERLKPEGLYQQFVRHREAFGAEIFPTGTPGILDVLAERLASGDVLALMGDRDVSRRGVAVPLFGEPASLPAGPALLAVRTGAPLLPVDLWYDVNGHARARVGEVIAAPPGPDESARVHATLALIAAAFEVSLRAHVVDWHMMQPVWLADLDPNRRAAR